MAVNVYTPGCHLLCHDDVIGTRRVSYILYLTDPDEPWRDEWGGALRLYPTLEVKVEGEDGKVYKVPSPDASVRIPPAFGQLSFFAVQPGESFHDVEEVYADDESKEENKRVRTAISGWYHIPQEGEDGYEPGLEEKLAEKSSLMQLQGKADQFDLPQSATTTYHKGTPAEGEVVAQGKPTAQEEPADDDTLTQSDLEFLLNYLAPTYLTPDTLDSVAAAFTDNCSLVLDNILSQKFSESLRTYILDQESLSLPQASTDIESKTTWKVARPPHKHRFLFQQPKAVPSPEAQAPGLQTPPASFPQPGSDAQAEAPEAASSIQDLLNNLLPSTAFKKWLQLATSQTLLTHNLLARRFRRGKDYTLATGYEDASPRLEITLAITPTKGWGDDEDAEEKTGGQKHKDAKSEKSTHGKDEAPSDPNAPSIGGYLVYIAGDDDNLSSSASDDGVEVPPSLSTGAPSTGPAPTLNPKKTKADPAVYKAATDPEDDGVLFSMPASWNRLGIVLRDQGTMRFVKYVSASATGDRWDLVGEFAIVDEGSDGDGEDDGGGGGDGDGDEDETEVEGFGESSEESSD